MNHTLAINPSSPIDYHTLSSKLAATRGRFLGLGLPKNKYDIECTGETPDRVLWANISVDCPTNRAIVAGAVLEELRDWLTEQGIPADYLSDGVEVA